MIDLPLHGLGMLEKAILFCAAAVILLPVIVPMVLSRGRVRQP